jgi:hypothetical protein
MKAVPRLQPAELILWSVAFIEGFSTLAVEVIAIRLAIPVAGSSMILTGVMLGVVLFALSAGYWRGGELSSRWDAARTRKTLARNLLFAAILYGIAFPFEAKILDKLLDTLDLPEAIGLTATLLFALPVYFASQTVPMLAELTSTDGKAGKASGKVLFFSTIGSVAGGVVTPVWLFPSLGVTRSTYLVCAVLVIAACVMGFGYLRIVAVAAMAAAAFVAPLTAHAIPPAPGEIFAFDSAYQSLRIVDEKMDQKDGGRIQRVLKIGGGRASGVYADTKETSFSYTIEAEHALASTGAKDVLVIGAAGFTFPRDAARMPNVEHIDAVDVDPVVKDLAERHFLLQSLSPKIQFLPLSARYAVRKLKREGKHYGFAQVDAYFGKGIPDELLTAEFFADVRAICDHTGLNAGLDRELESSFARNLLATFQNAYGEVWLIDANPGEENDLTNMLVLSWPAPGAKRWSGTGKIYRDDKNTADRDRVALIWGNDG